MAVRYKPVAPEHAELMAEFWSRFDANTSRYAFHGKSLRTPPWANHVYIDDTYFLARRLTADTGVPHEVDHIIPLHGRKVSGLHVEDNLRVITKKENNRKLNIWKGDWDE